RVPTPAIVEAEEPHLAGCDSMAAPRDMPKQPVCTVMRGNFAARESGAVHRNPSRFDLDAIAGESTHDLAHRLRVAGARASAQIAARETLLGDRDRQACRDQFATLNLVSDDTIDACRCGAVRVRDQYAERIADCD